MTQQYYSPYPSAPQNPYPASKAMAGWSLGLAIAFCVPLATLVSAGLAIAVLVKGRDGRDHGKNMAIAALVIDGLVLLLIVGLVVTGAVLNLNPEADRDPDGRITERQEVSTLKILQGDCLDDPQLLAARGETVEATTIEAVPCDEAHDLEAYHVFDLEGQEYPGDERAFRMAARGCVAEFRPFVGRSYRSSELEFWTYYPLKRSWDFFDDRAVVCVIGHPEHKTRGTLANSDR